MRKTLISLVLILCIGCAAHRTGPNPQPVTALEQINVDNADIAIHNRAAAKAIIAAKNAGFIDTVTFDELSGYQIKITVLHQHLTPLLRNPVPNSGNIQSIISQMADAATAMIASGNAGIKNEQSKAQIVADISAIKSLVAGILASLQSAGVLHG